MKTVFSLATTISIFIIWALPALAGDPAGRDLSEIRKSGSLIVSMFKDDRPPFFWHGKNGKWSGFDVTIAEDIAAQLGVSAGFLRNASSFDAVVDQVAQGKADIGISKLSMTVQRALRVNFTDPYLVIAGGVLVNKANFFRLSVSGGKRKLDQPGSTIGVVKGTSYFGFAKDDFAYANLHNYASREAMYEGLVKGEVTGVYGDDVEFGRFLSERKELKDKLVFQPIAGRADILSFAVSTKASHLLNWLNVYLRDFENSGRKLRTMRQFNLTP